MILDYLCVLNVIKGVILSGEPFLGYAQRNRPLEVGQRDAPIPGFEKRLQPKE